MKRSATELGLTIFFKIMAFMFNESIPGRKKYTRTAKAGDLRTFALIVSAHPYCARNSQRNITPRHASSARAEKTV